jgi:hypothetical protein
MTYNQRKLYRDAAQLAAIQLDRPFTAQEIARVYACIEQAKIAQSVSDRTSYSFLSAIADLTPSLSTEVYKPLAELSTVEEAIDEGTRRIANIFAPQMPKADLPPETN